MTAEECIKKMKQVFIEDLIEIEDLLIHDKKDDALEYIMSLLKKLTNKE